MNNRHAIARMTHRRKDIRSGVRTPLVQLGLAVALATIVAACDSNATAPPPAAPLTEVGVAQVISRQVRQWDDFTGRISAVESVALRPRVSGYIDNVAYREGDEVRKGQLLFVIDPRPYQAALARATAQLESARSSAQLAQAQGTRAKALIEAKAISREEFESRNSALGVGNATVRGAEAAVASAKLDLQFTQVRSPIDGRAGRAAITAGNLAQADATLLTTVVSVNPMYVDFESDEQTFLRYNALARNGQRATTDNAVRVGLADAPGYPYTGTVDFIDNQVDPSTGTIRARAIIDNTDRTFTPGLFARVQLEGSTPQAAVLINEQAVVTDQDRRFVYVVGADSTAQRRDVVLGRTVDGLRIVQSGLAARDKVIVNGVQKVFFPGMPVKATTVAMLPPAAADAARVAGR